MQERVVTTLDIKVSPGEILVNGVATPHIVDAMRLLLGMLYKKPQEERERFLEPILKDLPPMDEGQRAQVDEMVKAVREGKPPPGDVAESRRTLGVAPTLGFLSGGGDFWADQEAAAERVKDPKPWQVSLRSNSDEVPDAVSTLDLGKIWRVGYKEARSDLAVALAFVWIISLIFFVVTFGDRRAPLVASGALAVGIAGTVAAVGLSWFKLSSGSMYSILSMPPRSLGHTTSPFDKKEKTQERALVDRAIERGHWVVTSRRWGLNRYVWVLQDGTRIDWKEPGSGKSSTWPARVRVFTPAGGDPDTHRRFKGQMLDAIDEVRSGATNAPAEHALKVAAIADEPPKAA